MTDIVERLRAPLGVMQCEVSSGPAPENKLERRWLLALEAATKIERLRAALREIESITVHSGGDIHGVHPSFWEVAFKQAQDTARAALKEDGDE